MKNKPTPQQKVRSTRFRNTIARSIGGIIENCLRAGSRVPSFILERISK